MRLRAIQRVLRDGLPRLAFDVAQLANAQNYRVLSFRPMIDAVAAIRETGMFQDETATILRTDVLMLHAEDGFVVTIDTVNQVNAALQQLRSRGNLLLETLDANLEKEAPDAVSVKLPDASDLAAVADLVVDVNKALQQLLLNEYVNGTVRLVSFDRGSNWIELLLGSIGAVKLLGMVLRMIMDIRLKEVEIATRWESYKVVRVKSEILEPIKEALALEVEEFKAERLRAIAEGVGIPQTSHETLERVKFATGLLKDLIERGAEIEASIEAATDVRDEFPSSSQLSSLLKELLGPKKEIQSGL